MHTLVGESGHLRLESGHEEGMIGELDAFHSSGFGMGGDDHAVLDKSGHLRIGDAEIAEVKTDKTVQCRRSEGAWCPPLW